MVTHGNLTSNALALHEAWKFQPGRRAAARAAAVPRARPVRRAAHGAAQCEPHDLPAALRCGTRSLRCLPRATVFMGVPTYYVRLLAEAGFDQDGVRAHAPVRLGLRAARARHLRGVPQPHRPRHPRALRHDRNRDEHLEPVRRRAPRRHGRACRCRASRCAWWTTPTRRCRRRDRPHPGARAERDARLLEAAGEEQGGVHRATASSAPATSAPTTRDGYLSIVGPRQGHGDLRRLQRLSEGNRDAARRAAAACASRRCSACRMPTSARRSWRRSCSRRARRLTEQAVIAHVKAKLANFKVPKRVVFLPRAAAQRDGQGAEDGPAHQVRRPESYQRVVSMRSASA